MIAVISILSYLVLPSLTGLTASGKFDSAISGLSETLSLARETAVARDTYVWVAFSVPVAPTDPPLSTLVVASTDGTNPFSASWSNTVTLPNAGFLLVTKPTSYAQCQLIEAGTLTSSQIPSLPNTPVAVGPSGSNPGNGLSLSSALSFTYQTSTGLRTYNRVVEYSPSGLVYNGPNPVNFVEFGIEPASTPTAAIKPNVALLRVPFITGRTQLYRP